MDKVLVGLGSNIGDRHSYIYEAINYINEIPHTEIIIRSNIIETESLGFTTSNFYNCVILIETLLSPFEFHFFTKKIEKQYGKEERERNQEYKDRKIDIDLLIWEKTKVNTKKLILPHPEILKRKFVLFSIKELSLKNEFVNSCENWNFFYNLCPDNLNIKIII